MQRSELSEISRYGGFGYLDRSSRVPLYALRPRFWPVMFDGTETGVPMSDTVAPEAGSEAVENGSNADEPKFTQADIDKAVRERLAREKAKYADYDELKTKAEGAKTLEQQFAELKSELASTKTDEVRARIAAEYGISTKKGADDAPSDADLFLTGIDEDTMRTQAARLGSREADRKKHGNVAPREGAATNSGSTDAETASFLSRLTGAAN